MSVPDEPGKAVPAPRRTVIFQAPPKRRHFVDHRALRGIKFKSSGDDKRVVTSSQSNVHVERALRGREIIMANISRRFVECVIFAKTRNNLLGPLAFQHSFVKV
jgi:hypothetical protein